VSRSQFNSDKACNSIFKPMENVKIVFLVCYIKNLVKIALKFNFPSWKQFERLKNSPEFKGNEK